jgi:4-aminobutyrate aminotransferase and related aminotransferases
MARLRKGKSKSENIIARDNAIMIKTTREPYNFVAESGTGEFVYDVDGRKFIDFSSFISVYNFGVNSSEAVRKAIAEQSSKLMHSAFTDFYAERPVHFAESLMKFMPAGSAGYSSLTPEQRQTRRRSSSQSCSQNAIMFWPSTADFTDVQKDRLLLQHRNQCKGLTTVLFQM